MRVLAARFTFVLASAHSIVRVLSLACAVSFVPRTQVSLTDASLRWMIHHSKLSAADGDRVILGASKMGHLKENLNAWKVRACALRCILRRICELQGGPLHEKVLRCIDELWELTRPLCPPYFRT